MVLHRSPKGGKPETPRTNMGAGASTHADGKVRIVKGAKLPANGPKLKLPKENTDGIGALDASDIKNLEEAKEEIRRLRLLAKEANTRNAYLERRLSTVSGVTTTRFSNISGLTSGVTSTTSQRKKEARAAVVARGSDLTYVKKTIPKSDQVRNLIYHSIKRNMLFRTCSEEELQDIIDAFDTAHFKADSVVIQQGDAGDTFYVVEEGQLDIMVSIADVNKDTGASSTRECQVGAPYLPGSSFGELALMYGSPRAATIRAKTDCALWSLDRNAFKCITGSYKKKREGIILDTIRKVKIGDQVLGEVLDSSAVDAMALATQSDEFRKGDVIIRQGETGDAFYIIESGTIDVFISDQGTEPVARLTSGQFFGEKALLSEDVRQATCIAATDAKCLTLTREDFVQMLGNLQDLLKASDKRLTIAPATEDKVAKKSQEAIAAAKFELDDFDIRNTLGVGAFGRVKLVKVKPGKILKNGNPDQTYALKCLSKRVIVDNGLQDHVVNERKIMSELNHPFILTFHGAMQDDQNVYFLLEILLGGELFRTLRGEGQFPESWSRFYAASVILAFCQIHSKQIAYRDLKPENLVMDAQGYLKIVDFGLAKKLGKGKTWTLCGTPDYLAPEVILNEGHDWAVDYWGLGVLIYEMTAGTPPFYAENPMEVYEKILSGEVHIPSQFSRGIGELIKKLLKISQSKRLGRTQGGASSVMKQKWFSGFDWHSLLARELAVPFKPDLKDMEDLRNFDRYPEEEESVHVSIS
jgi:cGMP-dependent protein kinase